MESMDDPDSPDSDMFDNRSTIADSSKIIEDEPGVSSSVGVSSKGGKDEMSFGASRKINHQTPHYLPKVAVPEKIIICIENSQEKGLGYSFSDLNENSKEPNTFAIRNEAIRMFMINKLALSKDTEFAIVSIEPRKLERLSPFTSNVNKLSKSLRDYKSVFNVESDTLDITSLFSDLLVTVDIPEYISPPITLPNHIVRVILVYNSSFIIPQVNTNDPTYLKIMRSPCFFLDIFYLHEKQSDFNNVEKIYQEFGKIVNPSSYLLESSRDVTAVFNNAMKLLAHPNQRVNEYVWDFNGFNADDTY
jgi:hypothetical protein